MAFYQANEQVDNAIRLMRQQGFSIQAIKKALHVGQARIKWCIENEEGACFHDDRGCPPVVTAEIRNVEERTLLDSRLSNADMSDQMQQAFDVRVHATTIARLRQDLKFKHRPPMICQQLTPAQQEQRLRVCDMLCERGLMSLVLRLVMSAVAVNRLITSGVTSVDVLGMIVSWES